MYVYKLTQFKTEYIWDSEEETTYEEEHTSYLTHEKLYTDKEFKEMVKKEKNKIIIFIMLKNF